VAGLTTTATRSADGKSYVINGEKKWVTQGQKADVGLIAARTGPSTAKGISVFIVPLNSKGISRRKMENSGVSSSGEMKLRLRNLKISID
jgi:alkylation response protein AidB-like acyl-CoA dehydrogenase